MKAQNKWIKNLYYFSPIFNDLQIILEQHRFDDWPDSHELNNLLPAKVQSAVGARIQFTAQNEHLAYPHLSYEERIYYYGLVSTREQNWHDFFNAVIWSLFPRTKVVMNKLHIDELALQTGKQRTQARDAITHLDESGIVIVSDNIDYLQALQQHQWDRAFRVNKEAWHQSLSALIIGHGIYEKALQPFIGMTAKMYPLLVEQSFFKFPRRQQYQCIDELLAQHIQENNSLKNNTVMSPLPLLGIPGWYPQQDESFYRNRTYFRSKQGLNR